MISKAVEKIRSWQSSRDLTRGSPTPMRIDSCFLPSSVLYRIVQYRITSSNPSLFPRGNGSRSEESAIRDDGRTESAGPESKLLQERRQESI